MCDPYLFDIGEEALNKAEAVYKENMAKLGKDLYRKFLMKKSAFLKKYGFFVESYELLIEIKNEIMEELKSPDEKSLRNLRKALAKVYRDQARVLSLRRKEVEAREK